MNDLLKANQKLIEVAFEVAFEVEVEVQILFGAF